MKIAVLGTGDVGKMIGGKLADLGHEVKMGSRSADHEGANAWAKEKGEKASVGTFADAAAFGETVILCLNGSNALSALEMAGAENLGGKVVIDITNPLDFSNGFPPTLTVCNDDSLGEQIQKAYPKARVVKTLNTLANPLMVDASLVPDTDIFISGNDDEAKATVKGWLREWFGWSDPIDLGDITTARGTEMWLPLWVRLFSSMGNPMFNLKIVKAAAS